MIPETNHTGRHAPTSESGFPRWQRSLPLSGPGVGPRAFGRATVWTGPTSRPSGRARLGLPRRAQAAELEEGAEPGTRAVASSARRLPGASLRLVRLVVCASATAGPTGAAAVCVSISAQLANARMNARAVFFRGSRCCLHRPG